MESSPSHAEAIKFAGLLREGLAQHLAGTLLSAYALASKLRRNESSEVVEAGQLVSLLHAAIDDMSDLITKLQTGASEPPAKPGASAFGAEELAQLIHDKVAQEAAAAILIAGLLNLGLEAENSPQAAQAKKLTEILNKLSKGISETIGKLHEFPRDSSKRKPDLG